MSSQCNTNCFLLLYGSQTGQAKAIAEEINNKAQYNGLTANVYCLSLTDKKFNIAREDCVVIIVSTTGDGEPPDTVLKFWRRIKKRTLPDGYLKQLHYTLLALGDSNYNNFCKCGKSIDKRLEELGASKFYPTGYGDDAIGLEVTVDPWIDGLWHALKNQLCLKDGAVTLHIALNNNNKEMTDHNWLQTLPDSRADSYVNSKVTKVNMSDNKTISSMKLNTTNATSFKNANSDNSFTKSILMENELLSSKYGANSSKSFLRLFSPLNISMLTLPTIPASFLTIEYFSQMENISPSHGELACPSAASQIFTAMVASERVLTSPPDVKNTLELTIDITGSGISFQPGDTFGFLCSNSESEVQMLLERLNVIDHADTPCKIIINKDTKKQQQILASRLPLHSTLRQIFLKFCEIRAVPKKAFLCKLADYTAEVLEKNQLLYLSSREGTNLYTLYIRNPRLSLLDLLFAFPSCMPTVEAVIENLPQLQPRFYSVISLPWKENVFKIVFNIVHIMADQGRFFYRQGICTGWLNRLSHGLRSNTNRDEISVPLVNDIRKLSLKEKSQVKIYKRRNPYFFPPKDLSVPLIMIGPGTGVAPFVGFLFDRKQKIQELTDQANIGDTWLFYGCRYKERDFLYREDLEDLHKSKVLTHLAVSFSRDINSQNLVFSPKYVQDNIKHFSSEIIDLIITRGAKIYVCGDARRMAQDVFQAFIESYQKVKGCTVEEATDFFKRLQEEKHYNQDIWA